MSKKNASGSLANGAEHTSASKQLMSSIVEDLKTAIVVFDKPPAKEWQPTVTFSNAAFRNITGFTETEFAEVLLPGLFSRDADVRETVQLEHELKEGRPVECDVLLRRKSGENFWAQLNVMPSSNKVEGWVMLLRDVSARKLAEDALARENQKLAVTLGSIGDGVITVNTECEIDFINHQAERIVELEQKDALGKTLREVFRLIDDESKNTVEDPLLSVFRSGKRKELSKNVLLLTASGRELRIRCSVSPIIDDSSRLLGGVLAFSDISDQMKQEEELQKSQRMESIAMLSSGIAHDFNNILTGILGNLSLATRHCDDSNPLGAFIGSAEKAAMRAKDLTYQLLTFARGGAPTRSKTSMRQLLSESANFILRGSNCRLDTQLEEGLWPVSADEGQISQVLNNLLINASQAMPKGGCITIVAENADIGGEPSLPLSPGNYSKITISDEGSGISVQDMARIFDPYFTTKKEGTGLGLSMSYTIIKNHQGHILVDSEEGIGTTFTLYLPALADEDEPAAEQEAQIYYGEGRILVLDDELIIHEIVGDMLCHLGYDVAFATNGREAIEKYESAREQGKPFDLLLLDMTLPGGVGGKEVLEELLARHSGVRAVLSSGYTDNPIMKNYRKYGFCGTICKPYNIQEISWVLKNAIAEGREESAL